MPWICLNIPKFSSIKQLNLDDPHKQGWKTITFSSHIEKEGKRKDLGIAVIDDNVACAFLKNDSSNGAFTATSAEDRLGSESTG